MLSYKRRALINLKNIYGWRTNRKIVVFSVDDYGNIRMASQQARKNLEKAGLDINQNRFDQFDCLEDRADLEQLYDSLSSVKDQHGNSAVFTAFAASSVLEKSCAILPPLPNISNNVFDSPAAPNRVRYPPGASNII